VQKTLSDGSSVTLSTRDYILSGFNPWRRGTQRVTVTYQEQTAMRSLTAYFDVTADFKVTVEDIAHTLPVFAVDTQDRPVNSATDRVTGASYTLTDIL